MIKDFFDGIRSYGRAVQVISSMGLWSYLLIPGLISLFLAGGIGMTAWGFADSLGALLISWYPFDWGLETLANVSVIVGALLIAILGIVVYKHLVMVVVSPFMSPLSQKVEEKMQGIQNPYRGFELGRALSELVRGLRIAIRNIIREMLLVFVFFLLGLIPFFSPFTAVLIFLIQAFYAGFGNMDYTLERHFSVRESVRFVRANRGLAAGNGTVFLLLLMTGIGFIFAPPLATVAATLETAKRLDLSKAPQEDVEDFV